MPRRFFKQLIYGLIYLSIVGYILYGVWNSFSHPTCFDHVKNHGEAGVDCGGPCELACETRVLAPLVMLREVWLVEPQSGSISLAAQIKNPNLSWGAKEFTYSFILNDTAGAELRRVTDQGYILPGETRWVVQPAVPIQGSIGAVSFEISKESIVWQKLKLFAEDVKLPVRNVKFRKIVSPEVGFAELVGQFDNRSGFTLDRVEASGLVFDDNNKVIALGKTFAATIKPGDSRDFVIKWANYFPGKVARVEAGVSSNFLADQNFIQKYGE